MAEYRVKEGKEDRTGEMTGAISFNMILVFLPTTIWCFVLLPWLGITYTLLSGLVLAIVLTLVGLKLSQKIWAFFSEWVDSL